MTCTSDFRSPVTDPELFQNPAYSGYRYGWESCAAFVGARAAAYASCGTIHPSGAQVRNKTNEAIPDPKSPGLTITQVADALAKLGVSVTTFARFSWGTVEELVDAGHYVSLCGGYSVLQHSRFTGDPNFSGNHQVGLPPGWEGEDPLTDGRRAGIYRYHAEPYPRSLLRAFAGAFRITYRRPDGSTYSVPIGLGWAQGFYTTAHPVVTPPPTPEGGDVAIAAAGIGLTSGYVIDLPLGQPFYDAPNGKVITKLSKAAAVAFTGYPVTGGWSSVIVKTGALYPDGVSRPSILYVPMAAGKARPK
jgi:hypothetical protein